MRAVHLIPHPPIPNEGHSSRHATLKEALPDLELAWTPEQLRGPWDLVVVETLPAWEGPLFEALRSIQTARLVHVWRAQNVPRETPEMFDLTIAVGPYEGTDAVVVPPLVRTAPERKRDLGIVLVTSNGQPASWALPIPGLMPVTVASGWAAEMVARAQVVIAAAGGGILYETLWSGTPLIAFPRVVEQVTRADFARRAGEAIVVTDIAGLRSAVRAVQQMPNLGRREAGARVAIEMALGLAPRRGR